VDEIGGNEHFARTGAIFVGRDLTREAIVRPKPVNAAPGDGRAARQARMPAPEAAPTITFANEMGLYINGQDVKLIAIPRAHTDNDAIIQFPALDIIVVGDVLRAGEYPSVNRPSGGTLPGMLAGLDKMLALAGPNTKLVTAHGQVVGREALIAQRTLLVTTRDRVAAMIKDGKTVEQAIAADLTKGLGATALPGHVGADAFVRDVYAELKTPAKP
jgi:glyoxylase-like metal-dependent hydrolase (beta-lactamase superfamily II)